ncbi:uncharacterized protein V6R79_013319 [Siganus canaliculatus]
MDVLPLRCCLSRRIVNQAGSRSHTKWNNRNVRCHSSNRSSEILLAVLSLKCVSRFVLYPGEVSESIWLLTLHTFADNMSRLLMCNRKGSTQKPDGAAGDKRRKYGGGGSFGWDSSWSKITNILNIIHIVKICVFYAKLTSFISQPFSPDTLFSVAVISTNIDGEILFQHRTYQACIVNRDINTFLCVASRKTPQIFTDCVTKGGSLKFSHNTVKVIIAFIIIIIIIIVIIIHLQKTGEVVSFEDDETNEMSECKRKEDKKIEEEEDKRRKKLKQNKPKHEIPTRFLD